MDQPIEKMGERAGGLEENMNERFLRLEAEIARRQADVRETKAIAREGVAGLPLIEKRLAAAENA